MADYNFARSAFATIAITGLLTLMSLTRDVVVVLFNPVYTCLHGPVPLTPMVKENYQWVQVIARTENVLTKIVNYYKAVREEIKALFYEAGILAV